MAVQQMAGTVPLVPVAGKAPVVFALPALIGHPQQLRSQLAESFKGRKDSVFLVPATDAKGNSVVWRVFWQNGNIRSIEEYQAFSDPKLLVDKGLGDEENRARIQSRLSDPVFSGLVGRLNIPPAIATYNVVPMPPQGVDINVTGHALILSIAERDPTYFDLCGTPFSLSDGKAAYIPDTVMYAKRHNGALGMKHSGDVNFTSNGGDPRKASLQVLGHSMDAGQNSSSTHFAVTVSGYNNTPLIRFEKWRPTVVALDHENQTIYYCGVRLDEATAGKNTVCVVMMCTHTKRKNTYHVQPLPGPYGMGDCNSLPPALFKDLVQ